MKFIVSSALLSRQLAAINGVIAGNSIIPILENFLFQISPKQLTITASDLQTSITASLPVEAQESASIAIPARILLETLRNLPEQPVTFSIDQDTYSVEISSSNGRYRLVGENATDFPQITMVGEEASTAMPADVLKKAINQTIVATSTDELRPAMNGVYMDFGQDDATFVATDGHRLVRYVRADVGTATQRPLIVLRKSLTLLNTLLPNDNPTVTLIFNDTYIRFQVANISMISRLIDERYPDYENVIPKNNTNTLTISRLDFINSLKRIAIYANKTTQMVKLELAGSELHIFAEDLDFSNEASERLTCEYEGDDLEICFNAKFLLEMLTNLHTEEINVYLSGPGDAVLLLPKEETKDEEILLLIMPVVMK